MVLKLETGNSDDYYINFNRARGINSQNDEADDEVTIVKTGQNGVAYSQSWLQKSLQVGESHTLTSGFGSKSIVVKLLSIDKSDANMWKANVLVKDSRVNSNGSSPPNSQPTSQPTKNVSICCECTLHLRLILYTQSQRPNPCFPLECLAANAKPSSITKSIPKSSTNEVTNTTAVNKTNK